MSHRRRISPVAILVLLLATFLRFHLIEAQSFWNDEGNSARLSERSLKAIIEGTASDIHPPLYYLLLRGWRELAGETEFGLRSFSAYTGVLLVAVVLAIGRRCVAYEPGPSSSSIVAAVAGLLAATSPVLVYYSQETRMYALLALLAALSTWVLLIWLGSSHGFWRPTRAAVAYVFLLVAGLYTQYFFPAVIIAHGLVVFWWWLSPDFVGRTAKSERNVHGHRIIHWLGLVLVALLLYTPWIPIFLRQVGGRNGTPVDLPSFASASGRWLILGETVALNEVTWAVIAAAALSVLGVVAAGRRSIGLVTLIIVPLAAMYFSGATDPAYFKFLLVVVPFIMVLFGHGWAGRLEGDSTLAGKSWLTLVAILTVLVLAGSLVSLGNLYNDPAYARADYRSIAARVAAEDPASAGIILNAPNQWEVFTYYHRNGAPAYPLPRGQPDPTILIPELEQIAAKHDRLYVLYWGDTQRDPDRVVERWLDANTFKVSEEWVGDVRFVTYAVPRAPMNEPALSGAQFTGLEGEIITLESYSVWPLEVRPNDVIQVSLVWTTNAIPGHPYKVFLHLLDGSGIPVSQRDSEPAGGSRPTTTWEVEESIVDNHGLLVPGNLSPGAYDLRLGLYDAFDPTVRLPVAGGDSILLATLVVAGRD